MERYKVFPTIYQEHQNIDVHIDIHPLGHKYEMDLKGIGGRLRQKIDMLPEDLHQINNRIRNAFREIAFGETTDKSMRELAEAGYTAFLRVFDIKAREEFRKLLSYSQNVTIEITTDDFFLPWELLYIGNIED